MNLVASGDGGKDYTGSSEKEHTFGDGHGYHCSAAGTGTGSSCGLGERWKNGHSYQNSWEVGGHMYGSANGYGYVCYSGDDGYCEDD